MHISYWKRDIKKCRESLIEAFTVIERLDIQPQFKKFIQRNISIALAMLRKGKVTNGTEQADKR